jgi:hypothetical protein
MTCDRVKLIQKNKQRFAKILTLIKVHYAEDKHAMYVTITPLY